MISTLFVVGNLLGEHVKMRQSFTEHMFDSMLTRAAAPIIFVGKKL